MALTVIIAYDISSDNARARVAAMISVWGDRIQRSVYQCLLTTEALDDLLARIEATIDHQSDTVHVFRQCASCSTATRYVGQATQPAEHPYWII